MRISPEKSIYEFYLALSSASLSICVQTPLGIKELAFISIWDSFPKWEINVSHKWKPLTPSLIHWIEEKYMTNQTKCQLKEYIDVDLEKMIMTKPFYAELRRTHNPGLWVQLRKSETHTFVNAKIHRLQIDNQLSEAVFPTVLHPAPPDVVRSDKKPKPSIELTLLKQFKPSISQHTYKYLKILIQEHCINLDKGFVNYAFHILNHWKVEEKPAAKLRSDLGAVHLPLNVIASRIQINRQRNIMFEYVHLSPLTIVLSISLKGYCSEETGSPSRFKIENKRENRPKLFNSDLLDYLFNNWDSNLCETRDNKLKYVLLFIIYNIFFY